MVLFIHHAKGRPQLGSLFWMGVGAHLFVQEFQGDTMVKVSCPVTIGAKPLRRID
jgi:hypothetical protein